MNFRPLHDGAVVKPVKGEKKSEDGVAMSKKTKGGDTVVVDGNYIWAQATEALKIFLAPLSGVYAAAFGPISTRLERRTLQKSKNGD